MSLAEVTVLLMRICPLQRDRLSIPDMVLAFQGKLGESDAFTASTSALEAVKAKVRIILTRNASVA